MSRSRAATASLGYASIFDSKEHPMSDLDSAKELLIMLSKQSVGSLIVQEALTLLLRDYVERKKLEKKLT
jgi:hypothetical protein